MKTLIIQIALFLSLMFYGVCNRTPETRVEPQKGQKYIIVWQSKITGFEGRGKRGFNYWRAMKMIDELNSEYSGKIIHWLAEKGEKD